MKPWRVCVQTAIGHMSQNKEEALQITVPADVKKQVQTKALERDQTMRTFILIALRDHGIKIDDDDLQDRRRHQTKHQ